MIQLISLFVIIVNNTIQYTYYDMHQFPQLILHIV